MSTWVFIESEGIQRHCLLLPVPTWKVLDWSLPSALGDRYHTDLGVGDLGAQPRAHFESSKLISWPHGPPLAMNEEILISSRMRIPHQLCVTGGTHQHMCQKYQLSWGFPSIPFLFLCLLHEDNKVPSLQRMRKETGVGTGESEAKQRLWKDRTSVQSWPQQKPNALLSLPSVGSQNKPSSVMRHWWREEGHRTSSNGTNNWALSQISVTFREIFWCSWEQIPHNSSTQRQPLCFQPLCKQITYITEITLYTHFASYCCHIAL